MNAYPKAGAKLWALVKEGGSLMVAPVIMVGVDYCTGSAVLRWERPGLEVTLKGQQINTLILNYLVGNRLCPF